MADYCTLRDLLRPFEDGAVRLDRVVVGRTVYLALSAASEMRFAGKAGQIAPTQVAIDGRDADDLAWKILAKAVRNLLRRPEQRKASANIVTLEAFRWERGTPMITPAHRGKAVRPPVMVICTICWLLRVLGTVAFEFTADAGRTAPERCCDFISAKPFLQKFL